MARQLHAIEPREILLDDPMDVSFWMGQYGCTEDQLRSAVKEVGPVAQDVREQLAKLAKEALKKK